MSLPMRWIACGQYRSTSGRRSCRRRAQVGEVVGQRVHPDVDDVVQALRIAARAPRCPTSKLVRETERSRRPLLQERDDLVAVRLGPDEVRVRLDVVEQRLARTSRAGRTSCAPCRPTSTGVLWTGQMPRVAVLCELALGVERLAADAVPALVRRQVEVVGVARRGSASTAPRRRCLWRPRSCG